MIGVAPGFQLPGPELGEDGADERLACRRVGLGPLHEFVAAGGLEGPKGLPPILLRVVAEIGDHRAARSDRDSRMRCISMLPEDTVEACEYRQ